MGVKIGEAYPIILQQKWISLAVGSKSLQIRKLEPLRREFRAGQQQGKQPDQGCQ